MIKYIIKCINSTDFIQETVYASKDIRYDEFGKKRPVPPSSAQSLPDSLIETNNETVVFTKVIFKNNLLI